jgi:hypothetical protein
VRHRGVRPESEKWVPMGAMAVGGGSRQCTISAATHAAPGLRDAPGCHQDQLHAVSECGTTPQEGTADGRSVQPDLPCHPVQPAITRGRHRAADAAATAATQARPRWRARAAALHPCPEPATPQHERLRDTRRSHEDHLRTRCAHATDPVSCGSARGWAILPHIQCGERR